MRSIHAESDAIRTPGAQWGTAGWAWTDAALWESIAMPSESSALWMRRLPVAIGFGIALLLVMLLVPAVQYAQEAARRSQSRNTLKQIGLALDTYHETFRMFPPGGTFDAAGRPYHGWTTFLDCYLAQSAFIDLLDNTVPWDDPVNVDLFLKGWPYPSWQNPSVPEVTTADGFPVSHFTANQWVMHRNSSIRVQDLTSGQSSVGLVGDANGDFEPLGSPYQWRDLTGGLGKPQSGFGCPTRPITMIVMADGSVRILSDAIDSRVAESMAGPDELKPSPEQVAKPSVRYRLKSADYWLFDGQLRGHKGLMTLRLSPDRKLLKVDFGSHIGWVEATKGAWLSKFEALTNGNAVEHVELQGNLWSDELKPFLELPTLKRLTVSGATFTGDSATLLKSARGDILID